MKIKWFCIACFAGLLITISASVAQEQTMPQRRREMMQKIFDRLKQDQDGKLTRDEFPGPPEVFDRLDQDKDGAIKRDELERAHLQMRRRRDIGQDERQPGYPEGFKRLAAKWREKMEKGEKEGLRRDVQLKVGDAAPDFTLKTLDGKGTVTLSDSRGKKPVVLVFGSYT